jgi:hypothetical protein
MGFSRYSLTNYLPRLASNCDPPDLCLQYSYSREPPAPGQVPLLRHLTRAQALPSLVRTFLLSLTLSLNKILLVL